MAWLEAARRSEFSRGELGPRVGGPTVIGVQVEVLLKYLCVGCLFLASVMFYVWSRVDVRNAAAELDAAHDHHYALQVEAERLELELATRRDVGHLQRSAVVMGLAEGGLVVEIEGGATR